MGFLALNDIKSAAMDNRFIKDPFFQGLGITLLGSGKPEVYAGGFSQVFLIIKNNEKWAFKVWHNEIPDNRKRYQKIKKYLQEVNLPYFADFEYVEGGLLVDGELLDTLRMKWINGSSLTHYISYNLHNHNVLQQLADNFLTMTKDLHNNSIFTWRFHNTKNIYITAKQRTQSN